MKNLKEFKKNVSGVIGGRNSEIVIVGGERNLEYSKWEWMEDYGDGFLYEYNLKLDMVMISNVESDFVLFYNGEDLSEEEVVNIVIGDDVENGKVFFDERIGMDESEYGYRVLEDKEIEELLEGV